MKRIIISTVLFCVSFGAFCQTKTYTGTLYEEGAGTIFAANIKIVGENKGTTTDVNGKFSIEAEQGSKIRISFVGLKTATVTLGEENNLKITLKLSNKMLDEVSIKTNATDTRINRKVAQRVNLMMGNSAREAYVVGKMPVSSVLGVGHLIMGKVAGVNVVTDGKGGHKISIRGGGSPIYIVDNIAQAERDIQMLPSDDIHSVHITKGGTAGIHGSKGINGAIYITTKQAFEWEMGEEKRRKNKTVYKALLKMQEEGTPIIDTTELTTE